MNLHVSLQRETDELLRQPNLRLRIGEQLVDIGSLRVLTHPEQPRLTSKAVAVLLELVRHAGNTVTRDQLLDSVWKGRCPTPDVLTQAVKELRRAFGDDARPSHFIETIPKVGYRLLPRVLVLDGPDGSVFVDAPGPGATMNVATIGDPPATVLSAASARAAKKWWPAGILLAVVGIAIFAALATTMRTNGQAWSAADLRVLTSDPGSEWRPHISPDGTRLAFGILDAKSGIDRIVVRSIDRSQLVNLTTGSTGHEAMPVWSPNGMDIAFERIDGPGCGMFVASSLGGGEREVGRCSDYKANYYDWSPDGRSLITSSPDGGPRAFELFRWDLDTGNKTFLAYEHEPGDEDLEPHHSPDGRWIAFRRGVAPYSDLFVMKAAGGAVRQITHTSARIRGFTWARDNRTLIVSSNQAGTFALYTVDMDGGPLHELGVSPAEYPVAARAADDVVYEISRARSVLSRMALASGAAPPIPLAASTGNDFSAALSADGERVAFVSDRGGGMQIWLHERASGTTSALTDSPDSSFMWPNWSSDGKRILAVRHAAGVRSLIEIEISTRRQRALSASGENVLFGIYGIDPDTYLFAVGASVRENRLILVEHPTASTEKRRVVENGVAFAQIDATTRSVYYTTTGKRGLYRRELDTNAEHFVSAKVDPITMDGWRIVDGKVWHMSGLGATTAILHELDPLSGTERVIATLHISLRDSNFSVTPERDAIIVTPVGSEDTDVGTFRLSHTQER